MSGHPPGTAGTGWCAISGILREISTELLEDIARLARPKWVWRPKLSSYVLNPEICAVKYVLFIREKSKKNTVTLCFLSLKTPSVSHRPRCGSPCEVSVLLDSAFGGENSWKSWQCGDQLVFFSSLIHQYVSMFLEFLVNVAFPLCFGEWDLLNTFCQRDP